MIISVVCTYFIFYLQVHGIDVDLHVRLLPKPSVTDMALKRPLFLVNHFDVLLHHAFVGCHVVALFTLERLVIPMHSLHVRVQVSFLAKLGLALLTGKGLGLEFSTSGFGVSAEVGAAAGEVAQFVLGLAVTGMDRALVKLYVSVTGSPGLKNNKT